MHSVAWLGANYGCNFARFGYRVPDHFSQILNTISYAVYFITIIYLSLYCWCNIIMYLLHCVLFQNVRSVFNWRLFWMLHAKRYFRHEFVVRGHIAISFRTLIQRERSLLWLLCVVLPQSIKTQIVPATFKFFCPWPRPLPGLPFTPSCARLPTLSSPLLSFTTWPCRAVLLFGLPGCKILHWLHCHW